MDHPLPEAIVFDLDGVIVDSEPLHAEALASVCQPHGVLFDGPRFIGWADDAALTGAFAEAGRPMPEPLLNDLLERKRRRYLDSLRVGRVRPYPGAISLIRTLVAMGCPLALCSAAMRREIEPTLEMLGLNEAFGVIVGFEDAPRAKPHADPYQRTAQLLRIPAQQCLAIEDSPHGVASAKDAGLRVCAVGHTKPFDLLSRADSCHDTIANLATELLERFSRRESPAPG